MTEPSIKNSDGSGYTSSDQSLPIAKRVIQRAGGRHLVFRINKGPLWFVPKPYALISNIEGTILFFYGFGQIWVTHKKLRRIAEWFVRVPRFASKHIKRIVGELEPQIQTFIADVEKLGLIGTLVVERKVIEFHWTVPRDQRGDADQIADRKTKIDTAFNQLAAGFAKLQLEGVEGQHDCDDAEINISAV